MGCRIRHLHGIETGHLSQTRNYLCCWLCSHGRHLRLNFRRGLDGFVWLLGVDFRRLAGFVWLLGLDLRRGLDGFVFYVDGFVWYLQLDVRRGFDTIVCHVDGFVWLLRIVRRGLDSF